MTTANNPRQQRIVREQRKKKAGGVFVLVIAVFLIFCVSSGLYRMVKEGISRSFLDYEPAVTGEVEDGVKVKGLIIRPESVIDAPVSGRFENVVLNEARVKQGTIIGQLYPNNGGYPHQVQAPRTGMIILGTDGLETALMDFEFMACTPQILDYQANFHLMAGEEVEAGQPLFKIVDNLSPLQVVIGFKLADFEEPWESGKKITLRQGNKQYRVEVAALKGSGGTGMALLTFSADDQVGKLRTTSFTVIESRAEGVTVPVKSLVHDGAGTGVYILKSGEPMLQQVDVTCRNQQRAVVEGINNGDLVLTNPEHVKGAKPIVAR